MLRNITFSLGMVLLLLGPCALFGFQRAFPEFELPPALTAEGASYLSGSKTERSISSCANVEAFLNGELQSVVECRLTDYVPAREVALLGNARWQRYAIELSNALIMRYPYYPVSYGSSYCYIPAENAVVPKPLLSASLNVSGFVEFGEAFKTFSSRYPDKQFCLYVCDTMETADINPLRAQYEGSISTQDAASVLSANCADSNCAVLASPLVESMSDYYKYYFRSDHHWTIEGAVAGCNSIMEAFGREPVPCAGGGTR